MSFIIIGNFFALMASIFMVLSGMLKSKKKILFVQTIQITLFVISNLVLGGITGAIVNVISLVRNVLAYKDKLDKLSKGIIIALSVFFCIYFNNLGIVGYLPLISTVLYIFIINEKNVVKFKWLFIITVLLWGIYDLCIKSYTSLVFDFSTIVATIVSIFQIKNKKIAK